MTKRILLVDDEEDILLTLQAVLELQLGLPVAIETAPDGEAGRQALEARPYDMVIADERMPRLRGSELLRWARQHRPTVVRVLVTAYAEGAVREQVAREADLLAFKPFDVGQLMPTLRAALEAPLSRGKAPGGPRIIAGAR